MHTSKPSATHATKRGSIRGQLLRRLAVAALVPILLLGIAESVVSYRAERSKLTERLAVSSTLQAIAVQEFIQAHLSAVALLARTSTPDTDWERELEELREQYPAILTALHADRSGVLHATSPRLHRRGASVADRAYFSEPIRTGRPYVSDAFLGRGFGQDPLVAVSAPLWEESGPTGVVEASIHVGAFTHLRSDVLRTRGLEMLVLDRSRRVVHASAGLPFRFRQELGDAVFLRGPVQRDRPVHGRAAGVLRDGSDAFTARIGMDWGWSLVLLAPESTLHATLWRRLATLLAMLSLTAIGLMLAVGRVMRRFARSLEGIVAALQRLARHDDAALASAAVPTELQPLVQSINELNDRLDTARQDNLELGRLNRTDPLTGVLNRRGIDDAFGSLTGEATDRPVAVLAIDIDHFKRFNDRYGHLAGDAALQGVASAIASALRAGDVVGRTGGEEFVAILPDTDLEAACAIGERARAAVAALGIDHADSAGGRLSISIGAHAGTAGAGAAILIGRADRALYRAKHAGRNRVSV